MQLKDEPEGFNKAMLKQRAIEHLKNALAASSAAEHVLCLEAINHQHGEQLMMKHQEEIRRLIVEVSHL
jgi:hydroxypyruvate isomerase